MNERIKSVIKFVIENSYIKFLMRNNPQKLAEYRYKHIFGRELNWENPTEWNEKIRWVEFKTDIDYWRLLADKYRVRQYIESKGMSDILVQLYGVWTNANDIDIDKLPDSFVLKTNNGCGDVIVVDNKMNIDWVQVRQCLNRFLSVDYGLQSAEIQYIGMKPCIIAEEKLENDSVFSSSIVDYKFYVFNGKPIVCVVFFNRNEKIHYCDSAVYDMDWNYKKEWRRSSARGCSKEVPRPKNFEKMKQLCSVLCKDIPFCRLDLYECRGKVYLGEFTFTPAGCSGGSISKSICNEFGAIMDISNIKSSKEILGFVPDFNKL